MGRDLRAHDAGAENGGTADNQFTVLHDDLLSGAPTSRMAALPDE